MYLHFNKVHIFWEGHKILQNLHSSALYIWLVYMGQIYGGDFAKFCGLLRIHELYKLGASIYAVFISISAVFLLPILTK